MKPMPRIFFSSLLLLSRRTELIPFYLLLSLLIPDFCRASEPAVRVLLVGASTVAAAPKPPADRPDLTGWGQSLAEFFDEPVLILNHAKSGRSSKSFIREGLWKQAIETKPAYVFIHFGHNDEPGRGERSTDANSDYQDYLKQYINESRAAGAKPILVTPVARRTFKDGKIHTLLQPYVDAMKKVAKETKTPVIDLHTASLALYDGLGEKESADLNPAPTDYSHFSRKGARAIAKLVVSALPAAAPELAKHLKFPLELVDFVPYQTNPVFSPVYGAWDTRIRERGWIVRENGAYKLWYTGYDGSRDGTRMLGYATSPDGITWTRFPKNPLVRNEWVEDMMIVKDDGKYYMFAEGRLDRAHWLVSSDGIAWTPLGKLVVRHKNGTPLADGPLGTPTVWRDKDRWLLYYEREDLGIWLAASPDMKVWTNVQDEPVLSPGPTDYDKDLIALNQIIQHKDRYYAYYHGSAKTGPHAGLWSTCAATSKDLMHWEKYSGNPLLPTRANKSSGILVHDGQHYRLYTMHPVVYLHVPPTR
jgi:beta-1,2-mannobiose phosphorylase / 1,2-beta-oligomannan phosphorylase